MPGFDNLIGSWCSFYAEEDSVYLCCPVPGRLRVCGEIIGVSPLPNFMPGNIPNVAVKVRGRTGKTMTISFVSHYTTIHTSKSEAIKACDESNETKPEHGPTGPPVAPRSDNPGHRSDAGAGARRDRPAQRGTARPY